MTKQCKKCLRVKPLREFFINQTSKDPDARMAKCQECHREYFRDRYRRYRAAEKAVTV